MGLSKTRRPVAVGLRNGSVGQLYTQCLETENPHLHPRKFFPEFHLLRGAEDPALCPPENSPCRKGLGQSILSSHIPRDPCCVLRRTTATRTHGRNADSACLCRYVPEVCAGHGDKKNAGQRVRGWNFSKDPPGSQHSEPSSLAPFA